MASSNKTANLGLNKWVGSDKPKREDFVNDNIIVDAVVSTHINDTQPHIQPAERETWNTPFYIGAYYGNGQSSRVIPLEQPARFGVVFAEDYPLMKTDFDTKQHHNYFSLCSDRGSAYGLSLEEDGLHISHNSIVEMGTEIKNMNKYGTTYIYIMFR